MAPNSDGAPVATTLAGIARQTADVPSSNSYCESSHGGENCRGNCCNVNRGHVNTTSIMGRARFGGREPSMKGHIYDFTGERNPEQWIKITKEIVSFVGRTYTKFTSEFTEAVKELRQAHPEPTNQIALELWKLEIREYGMKAQEFNNLCADLYSLVLVNVLRLWKTGCVLLTATLQLIKMALLC